MTKLPAYFEKYFENKFSEITCQITELKHHVNDEIQIIRFTLQKLETQVNRYYWLLALLFLLFLIHDLTEVDLFSLVRGLFI